MQRLDSIELRCRIVGGVRSKHHGVRGAEARLHWLLRSSFIFSGWLRWHQGSMLRLLSCFLRVGTALESTGLVVIFGPRI